MILLNVRIFILSTQGQIYRYYLKRLTSVFYRILQESLTNACKHARANHILVTLHHGVDNICLEVKDDGQGFHKQNRNRNSMGIGLLGIKERLKMLDGRLEVNSQPGQGTILSAYIPWQENN